MRRLFIMVAAAALCACGRSPQADRPPADSLTASPVPPSAAPVDSGAPKLLPVDEADSSFRAFRERTLRALEQRDTAYLFGILSPVIKNSFGGDDSIAGFKRIWRMDEPNSAVWSGLARVLRMGGKLADSTFIAPYVYWFWPDSLDAFQYVAVTSERAAVYAQPKNDAEIVGTASYSILQADEWLNMGESFVATAASWVSVLLPHGDTAWLKATDAYSPIAWRAFFERRDTGWLLTLFVAGD